MTRNLACIQAVIAGVCIALAIWMLIHPACRYAASFAPAEPPMSRMSGVGQ